MSKVSEVFGENSSIDALGGSDTKTSAVKVHRTSTPVSANIAFPNTILEDFTVWKFGFLGEHPKPGSSGCGLVGFFLNLRM